MNADNFFKGSGKMIPVWIRPDSDLATLESTNSGSVPVNFNFLYLRLLTYDNTDKKRM